MKRLALPLALALVLMSPAAANAATETEPNDGIHQFNGPLAADTPYDGTLSTSEDIDWFAFYVSGAGTVNVTLTNTADEDLGCCPYFVLTDDTGERLNEMYVSGGESETIQYTTPGPGKYFVYIYEGSAGDRYSLSVAGPLTAGPPAEAARPTPNSNADMNSAFGPLEGDVLYGGRIDAFGEEDWFYFYVRSAGRFLVELTNIPDDSGCCPYLNLYDEDGEYLNQISVSEDHIGRLIYTAPKGGKYTVGVTDASAGDSYQLKVRPGFLLSPSPPPPSQACATATNDVKKFKGKVKKSKKQVRKLKRKKNNASGNRKAKLKRKLRRKKSKLKKQRGKLRGAKQQKQAAC